MPMTPQQFTESLWQYRNDAWAKRTKIDKTIPSGSAYVKFDGMQDACVHISTTFEWAYLQSQSWDAMKVIEFLEKEINTRIEFYKESAASGDISQAYKEGAISEYMTASSFVSGLRFQLGG